MAIQEITKKPPSLSTVPDSPNLALQPQGNLQGRTVSLPTELDIPALITLGDLGRDGGLIAGAQIKKNSPGFFKFYYQAAGKGSTDAMRKLGYAYQKGNGVPQDYTKARKWYEVSAARNNGAAIGNLAILSLEGRGVPKDIEKALDLFKKGAALEDSNSLFNLGNIFITGLGVPKDEKIAISYYEQAIQLGNANAEVAYAVSLYLDNVKSQEKHNCPCCPVDSHQVQEESPFKRVFELLQHALTNKDLSLGRRICAESLLGNCFTKINEYEQAFKHYSMAAALGEDTEDLFNVANAYLTGNGVKKNIEEAQKLLLITASRGHLNSMTNLGATYLLSPDKNEQRKAYSWFMKAHELGDRVATGNLETMFKHDIGVDSCEENPQMYEEAANKGLSNPLISLGNMHKKTGDLKKAQECYQKALDRGNVLAIFSLDDLMNARFSGSQTQSQTTGNEPKMIQEPKNDQ
jgi:TPR repeat protein